MPGKRGRPRGTIKAESEKIYDELTKLQAEHGVETIGRLRKSIQGLHLIKTLQDCVFGALELSSAQVQAAGILLRKIIPDLQAVQVDVKEDDRLTVIRAPERSPTAEAWQQLIEHKTIEHKSNGHSD